MARLLEALARLCGLAPASLSFQVFLVGVPANAPAEAWAHGDDLVLELPAGSPVGPAQAAMVVEIARATQKLLGPTHNFVAIREFREAATDEQKLGLLHCLFAVAGADGVITGDEEEEIRTIARGLLLEDRDYVAVRSGFSAKRSVLQAREKE